MCLGHTGTRHTHLLPQAVKRFTELTITSAVYSHVVHVVEVGWGGVGEGGVGGGRGGGRGWVGEGGGRAAEAEWLRHWGRIGRTCAEG